MTGVSLCPATATTRVIAFLACTLESDMLESHALAALTENAKARHTYRALGFQESGVTFERPIR
jgi:hypothetical protein